ncbi:MAG TPA: hypothetical protein VFQ44_28495 [Streptosporangiaceae bacterium]|nr:hypothetical protein [Streptosporangiaceae bacterium]
MDQNGLREPRVDALIVAITAVGCLVFKALAVIGRRLSRLLWLSHDAPPRTRSKNLEVAEAVLHVDNVSLDRRTNDQIVVLSK